MLMLSTAACSVPYKHGDGNTMAISTPEDMVNQVMPYTSVDACFTVPMHGQLGKGCVEVLIHRIAHLSDTATQQVTSTNPEGCSTSTMLLTYGTQLSRKHIPSQARCAAGQHGSSRGEGCSGSSQGGSQAAGPRCC